MRTKIKIAEFYNTQKTWSGYDAAEQYCEKIGLSVGQRAYSTPTALFDDNSVYVSKWHNLTKEDHDVMWGFIECPDKRNGTASIYKFIEDDTTQKEDKCKNLK